MAEIIDGREPILDVSGGMAILIGPRPYPRTFVDEEKDLVLQQSGAFLGGIPLYHQFSLSFGNHHFVRRELR